MKGLKKLFVSAAFTGIFVVTALAQNNQPTETKTKIESAYTVPGYKLAQSILGDDFISPGDVALARGLSYTKEQLQNFVDTLPSEEILRWAKENDYAVVAGPPVPMSLLDVRALKPKLFFDGKVFDSKVDIKKFYVDDSFAKDDKVKTNKAILVLEPAPVSNNGADIKEFWYVGDSFARDDKVTTGWLIISLSPVAIGKSWNDQLLFLKNDERVPNVAEISWVMTTFAEVRSAAVFYRTFVRTSSIVASVGSRVVAGYSSIDFEGNVEFFVSARWDDDVGGAVDVIGLSPIRSFADSRGSIE